MLSSSGMFPASAKHAKSLFQNSHAPYRWYRL